MVTISLCMIVKNEEQNLKLCLNSVKDIFDEIIIVDTGSTDGTREIAKSFDAKLYDFEWKDDFSEARNHSFSKAEMEYIFWIDADDYIPEEDASALKVLKTNMDNSIDIVMMKYDLYNGEVNRPVFTSYRERLLKRVNNYFWKEPVYEHIELNGNVITTDISIAHRNLFGDIKRNLEILEKIKECGEEFSERNTFYYARLLYLSGRYDEAEDYYNSFLNINKNFLPDYILACMDLADCYKKKNQKNRILKTLVRGFEYGGPNAEICCMIGSYYKDSKEYVNAIKWFETATKIKKPEHRWGLIIHELWDYKPYVELSECFSVLGKNDEALKYSEIAAKYK